MKKLLLILLILPFLGASQTRLKYCAKISPKGVDSENVFSENPYYNYFKSSLGIMHDYSLSSNLMLRWELIWNVRSWYLKTSDEYHPAFDGYYILNTETGETIVDGAHSDYTLTKNSHILNPFELHVGFVYSLSKMDLPDFEISVSSYSTLFAATYQMDSWEPLTYFDVIANDFLTEDMVVQSRGQKNWMEYGINLGVGYYFDLPDFTGLLIELQAPILIKQIEIDDDYVSFSDVSGEASRDIHKSIIQKSIRLSLAYYL